MAIVRVGQSGHERPRGPLRQRDAQRRASADGKAGVRAGNADQRVDMVVLGNDVQGAGVVEVEVVTVVVVVVVVAVVGVAVVHKERGGRHDGCSLANRAKPLMSRLRCHPGQAAVGRFLGRETGCRASGEHDAHGKHSKQVQVDAEAEAEAEVEVEVQWDSRHVRVHCRHGERTPSVVRRRPST